MTTNRPLLVSSLGICLAFGFTSRSCPSKASGNTNWNTVGSLCRSLLIEHIVSGYPGSAAGLSQPCNFTIGTPKTESLFPARPDTDVAEGSKSLQPRPGFRHDHTAADGRSDGNKYISLFSYNRVNISSPRYQDCRKFPTVNSKFRVSRRFQRVGWV